MFFSKKLRLASAVLGVAMLSTVFAGCGGDSASSDEIKVGANIEMTGNQANYGNAGLEGLAWLLRRPMRLAVLTASRLSWWRQITNLSLLRL